MTMSTILHQSKKKMKTNEISIDYQEINQER